jgi:hypothetical protein
VCHAPVSCWPCALEAWREHGRGRAPRPPRTRHMLRSRIVCRCKGGGPRQGPVPSARAWRQPGRDGGNLTVGQGRGGGSGASGVPETRAPSGEKAALLTLDRGLCSTASLARRGRSGRCGGHHDMGGRPEARPARRTRNAAALRRQRRSLGRSWRIQTPSQVVAVAAEDDVQPREPFAVGPADGGEVGLGDGGGGAGDAFTATPVPTIRLASPRYRPRPAAFRAEAGT